MYVSASAVFNEVRKAEYDMRRCLASVNEINNAVSPVAMQNTICVGVSPMQTKMATQKTTCVGVSPVTDVAMQNVICVDVSPV